MVLFIWLIVAITEAARHTFLIRVKKINPNKKERVYRRCESVYIPQIDEILKDRADRLGCIT